MYILYATITTYIFYGFYLTYIKKPELSNEEKLLFKIQDISNKIIKQLFINSKNEINFTNLVYTNCNILNNEFKKDLFTQTNFPYTNIILQNNRIIYDI